MPIRLNSKRVATKSIRLLGGRPLFCWALERADRLGIPVHVYSSASSELERLVDFEMTNVVFTSRPRALDEDDVTGIEIYRRFRFDVPAAAYLLIHCTSPFLSTRTLQRVIAPVVKNECDSSLTVRRVQTFVWFDSTPLNFSLPRVQTQKLKPAYVETSGAYCYRSEVLDFGDRSTLSPRLIEVDWPEDEDIDQESDFTRCEALLSLLAQHAID